MRLVAQSFHLQPSFLHDIQIFSIIFYLFLFKANLARYDRLYSVGLWQVPKEQTFFWFPDSLNQKRKPESGAGQQYKGPAFSYFTILFYVIQKKPGTLTATPFPYSMPTALHTDRVHPEILLLNNPIPITGNTIRSNALFWLHSGSNRKGKQLSDFLHIGICFPFHPILRSPEFAGHLHFWYFLWHE